MTSPLQEIADTMANEFRTAVIDAEKADVETIEGLIHGLNEAYEEYARKEQLLNTKAEQAMRTLAEISDLRDVNTTSYQRKVATLREQLAAFRETKLAQPVAVDPTNVVRLGEKA